MRIKALGLLCLLFFVFSPAIGQLIPDKIILTKEELQNKALALGKIEIADPPKKSLRDYFQIADTLDSSNHESDLVEIKGFDFQFQLRIQRDSFVYQSGNKTVLLVESRIPPYQLWRYNVANLSDSDVVAVSQELRDKPSPNPVLQQAYQNCFAYALEGIFRSHGIDPEPFFFRRSALANDKDWEVLLDKLFVKIETLDNIKTKTLRNSKSLLNDQVLILFRNYLGEPIHACFNRYGRTWSKNGMMPYTSYPSPYAVIDSYNDVKKIDSSYPESTIELMKLSSVSRLEIYELKSDIFHSGH